MPGQGQLHFRQHGGGASGLGHPALVLVHGAGGSSLHWPPQLRRLSGEVVYSLDLPGHAQSAGDPEKSIERYAQRLIAWLDCLELETVVLVGHSMGGAISLTVSIEAPHRIKGLVLVASGAKLRVHPQILALTDNETSYQQAVEWITQWAFSDQAEARMVELAQKRMAEVPPEVVHADFLACDHFDIMERLSEISVPTLVLCGIEDQLTPVSYSQYLVDHIPQARLVVIEGAGHMVMLEKPVEVVRQIQGFIRDWVGKGLMGRG
ncbi:MAG: hypothetical protein A2Z14_04245 [Chloroflexi bacterium RBG_16_48_8]|nr:MAG: hypothetical protein A2Z14_04245 [Chloroflexi bacterium RBG_16_48_8]